MDSSITRLAINLLISERVEFRSFLADRIKESVSEFKDASEIEKHLKTSFISVIDKCVENPNCKSREDFYQLAQFYNQKIYGAIAA